jgi:hypothetical protein
MRHIFMDETGDFGVGVGSKLLVLAAISPVSGKVLNKRMKNFNAHLINNRWNKDVEIKATNLWRAQSFQEVPFNYRYRWNPGDAIRMGLEAIASVDCHIEYIAVKLDGLPPAFQNMAQSDYTQ